MIIILLVTLACSVIAGLFFWYAMQHYPPLAKPLLFINPPWRHMTEEERTAVERYLASLNRSRRTSLFSPEATEFSKELELNSQSHKVYPVSRAITRYALSGDDPRKWRYYLDSVEVHLPPLWEQHIAEENYVELIKTQSIPLIISLNGHSLISYEQEREKESIAALPQVLATNASIRQEESEHIELLKVRKETPEEHSLSGSEKSREAMMICLGLFLFFMSLLLPAFMFTSLVIAASLILLAGLWASYRRPAARVLRDIHCLRGKPKRWGLFGESGQGHISNISLGSVDLVYPSHWQPYVSSDLGQPTDIDIYLNHHVARQGRFLSLHDEARHFPVQRWKRNGIIALGSTIILVLLMTWIPPAMPVKLSLAWLKGTENLQISTVSALKKSSLHVGDYLKISGRGMCSVPENNQNNPDNAFAPFDCSSVYWNTEKPLSQPHSDIVDKAAALLATTRQQLHPQTTPDHRINPQLATAIQKSGMVLLDNFSDIVLKTEALCAQEEECYKLKTALTNLGNVKKWQSLVEQANSGKLEGTNVLLRPVSATSLENLVNMATSSFFYRETQRAIKALSSPYPGGFLIINDGSKPLVSHSALAPAGFDNVPSGQWQALQNLSDLLLDTPFTAAGIITSLSIDANGTQRITLHSEPDTTTLWRYISITVLLLTVSLSAVINTLLAIYKFRRNRRRMIDIKQYYDKCFNHSLADIKPVRPLF